MTDYQETWDPDGTPEGSATDEPPPRPNFFKRIGMVFYKPGELFEALAPNPAWFPMAAFAAALVGLSFLLTPAEAFYETAIASTPPEQRAELQNQPWEIYKYMGVIFATVFVLVLPVLLSLLSYVIFVFMRGDEATFRQHLCVMSHTGVISALGALVAIPLRIVHMNVQESLSLGDLTPFLDGFAYYLLNGMDLFAIWACVVAGLGLSLLDPRRRWGPTATVLVGILVVFATIGATLQAMFAP